MNRRDFYLAQKVSEAELDDAFLQVENAERAIKSDMFAGANGFLKATVTVAQEGAGTQRVDIGTGIGWDKDGFRVSNPNASQFVDFTGDDDPVDPRIVAVYLGFDRVLYDPRLDGLNAIVNHKVDESFIFNKVLGTPAPGPVAPAADPSQGILLAHVTVPAAAGVILTAGIDTTVQNLRSSFPVARLADTLSQVIRGYIGPVKIVTTGAAVPTDTIDVEVATAVNGGASPDLLMHVRNAALDLAGPLGPGGLDVGVVANATYYVYLIGDTSGANPDDVMASLDAGPGYAGVGPSFANAPGYDRFRLIGCIIRDAGSIVPFRQIDGRTYFDDYILANIFPFGADPHAGAAPTAFVPLSVAPFCPPIAERVTLAMRMDTAGAAIVPSYHFRSGGGPTLPNYTNVFSGGVGASINVHASESHMELHVSATQFVDWRRDLAAGPADVEIGVAGFTSEFHHE